MDEPKNTKQNQLILWIGGFLALLLSYIVLRKIVGKAISAGITIFLILIVFLMIYLLGRI